MRLLLGNREVPLTGVDTVSGALARVRSGAEELLVLEQDETTFLQAQGPELVVEYHAGDPSTWWFAEGTEDRLAELFDRWCAGDEAWWDRCRWYHRREARLFGPERITKVTRPGEEVPARGGRPPR